MSSTSTNARDRAKATELIAALTRIRDLSESDREQVADDAAGMLVALREEVERLSEQVRWLAGKPYRPSREKVPPGQLAFELIQMLSGEFAGEGDAGDDDDLSNDEDATPEPEKKTRKKRQRRGRELPRQVIENRLDESELCCPDCDKTKAEIGFDKQERFIYEPAKGYILEERCYKYACRGGCGGVRPAEPTASPKPIPGSMASASLLAHLIVSKMLDGLPIERIAKRLRRHGVDLAPSTLNDWMGRAADMFVFLQTLLRKELLACSLVSLDDTPMPARSRGHPKGIQRGRQWIYLGDLDRVAKEALVRGAQNRFGELAGVAGRVLSILTNNADLRSWSLLPSRIEMALLPLPAGVHQVEMRLDGEAVSRTVELEDGQVAFWHHRFFH